MDLLSIGLALTGADGVVADATKAAKDANDAAEAANGAAQTANTAAAGANTYATQYGVIANDAVIDRTAFNFLFSAMQAEIRDLQKRLLSAEAKLNAIT